MAIISKILELWNSNDKTEGKTQVKWTRLTEEEVNSAKEVNMGVALYSEENDDEESDTRSTWQTITRAIKELEDMLLGVQTTLKDIQSENWKMRDKMAELKSSSALKSNNNN